MGDVKIMREQATGPPANVAPIVKAITLYLVVSTPMASAAISFSRIEMQALTMTGIDEVLDKQDRNHHQEERPGKRGIARNPH